MTWANFPTLGPPRGITESPVLRVDGAPQSLGLALDVDGEVRAEWKRIEGQIVASAVTRTISRVVVGKGIEAAAGKDNKGWGLLLSLAAQASLTALDTPDTRSWETLPARISVARMRLPAGRHRIEASVRGRNRVEEFDLPKGGWKVISLMVLR